MKTVELIMSRENENLLSSILIDGRVCMDSRLNSLMTGQLMQNWARENITRYAAWKGLIPELSSVLNTQNFTVKFSGTKSAYSELVRMLEAENANINLEFHGDNNSDDFMRLKGWVKSFIDVAQDTYLHRRLNVIYKSLGEDNLNINLSVLYDENGAAKVISYMPSTFIKFVKSGSLEITMPAVLSVGRDISARLEDISTCNDVPIQDIVILFVRYSCKKILPGVHIFSLSGDNAKDKQTLDELTSYYSLFLRRKLKKFLKSFPFEAWTDIEAAKALINQEA